MTEHLHYMKRMVNLSIPSIKKEFSDAMTRRKQAILHFRQKQSDDGGIAASLDAAACSSSTTSEMVMVEPTLAIPFLTDLRQEEGQFSGVKRKFHRVFVQASDSGSYATVGWVLTADLDHCMVCLQAFGGLFYSEVHHCRVCGNAVCRHCSPHEELVEEIAAAGPQRICVLCFYGQMPVNAMANNHLGVSILEQHYIAVEDDAHVGGRKTGSAAAGRVAAKTANRTPMMDSLNLWVYGPVVIQPVHGSFVIRARRQDRSVVFVNVCTCDEVPMNHDYDVNSPQVRHKISYILAGDCSRSVNDTDLYDVAVNPKVIDDFGHVDEKTLAKLKQDLCEQILTCLTVCKLESSFSTYSIEKALGKYLPHKLVSIKRKSMLDMLEHARESESNEYLMISAINQSLNIMDSYDGHLAIPAKKAFRDYHYVHTTIAMASEEPSIAPLLENESKQLQQESILRKQQIQSLLDNTLPHPQEKPAAQNDAAHPQTSRKSSSGWKNCQVLPRPGFVIKTHIHSDSEDAAAASHIRHSFSSATSDHIHGEKVFVNVLHHPHLDEVTAKYAHLHHMLVHHDPLTKSVLAFGPEMKVEDKEGVPVRLLQILVGSSHFAVVGENVGSEHVELPITADAPIRHILHQAGAFYKLHLDLDHFSLPKVRSGYKGELSADGMAFTYHDLPPLLLGSPMSSKKPERRGSSMVQWATELFALKGSRPRSESRAPHDGNASNSAVAGNRSRQASQDTVISNEDDHSTVATNSVTPVAKKVARKKSFLELVNPSSHNHGGSQLIYAHMMENDPKHNVSLAEANQLKQLAVDTPHVLLGWQITLYQHNGDVGIYMVTGARKNHLQKTEFCLSAWQKEDQWVALKRAEHKSGLVFKPNRKFMDIAVNPV